MKSMPPGQMQWADVKYSTTTLGAASVNGQTMPGGLDLTTPSLKLQPGALRDCLNFECAQSGGYSRIQGYERFSGQPAPSAASYEIVQFSTFVTTPAVGQTVTQASSGFTGQIVAIVTGAALYIVLTKTSGSLNYTGAITIPGPQTVGVPIFPTVSISSLLDAQYTAAAADIYRADIGPVPGSGAVLGVVGMIFNEQDNVYAFRANAAGTAVNIWKATPAGWAQVPLLNTVQFTGASATDAVFGPNVGAITIPAGVMAIFGSSLTVENPAGITVLGELDVTTTAPVPKDGDALIQGAVTATINRVQLETGSWSGTGTGHFVVTNPVGGNLGAGVAITSSGAVVTLSGPQAAITLAPGGHFEFVKCNFSGQITTRRIYGCDGVNRGFEFDGTTLVPINTGLSPDVPSHVAFHNDYLIFSKDASILGCAAGSPFKWSAIDGAWEIATGDTVTAMLTIPGSQSTPTLGVWMRANTAFLYGTDPTTFKLVAFNTGLGGVPYSVQNLYDTFACDDLGVITLRTTLNWGNFLPSTLTKNILPFIVQQRDKLIASAINRSKSQYRLFYSDGYGLWLTTVNQQYLGAAIIAFPNAVFCVDEGDTLLGREVTYFGSSDGLGYVYQMDAGTSFDGAPITAYITLAWNPIGNSRVLKRFRAASIEIQSNSYAQVSFGYQLGYGTPLIGQPMTASYATGFQAGARWDSFTWDHFIWDGQTLVPTDADMTGTGENVQVVIGSDTNYIDAYTLNSVIYHFTPRRGIRV